MLRNRIFLVILIGLVPIAVAAILGVYAVTGSHRADVARLEAAVLTEDAQRVTDFVDGGLLVQTSVVVPHGPGFDVSTSAQQFALANRLQAVPYLLSLSFINMNGTEMTHLDQAHPNGYPSDSLRDLSNDPGFLASRAGKYYIGPVSYASGSPVAAFATPFKDDKGNVLGVVWGSASLGNLGAVVGGTGIGQAGYLYLVDTKGMMIAGGGPFTSSSTDVAALPIVHRVINGHDVLSGEEQMQYNNVFGTPVVAAAKFLPEYGWGLVAEWPTSEANAVVDALLVRNAILFAVILLVSFVLALFLAAYIVQPIKKLQKGAARVAEGKFNEGVYIKTGDELEELGESFNQMVEGLKRLEELKDEFVFIAAHELRTPVAAMKGYLSLVLDGSAGAITPETKTYVEKVIASDNRLVQLVNDLLEVARSQAGRLTIKVAPMDIAAPIRAVLDELKSLADEKSVKVTYEPPQNLPQVMGDADRAKEVMVNLVGNAIKYMGGPGMVTVSHEVKDGALITHVTDTGLGISKEAQARLFEKFYRVQTEKTRDITGTGLGLFIVREIVEKMNGKIWAESEERKGSTFSFSLPVAEAV